MESQKDMAVVMSTYQGKPRPFMSVKFQKNNTALIGFSRNVFQSPGEVTPSRISKLSVEDPGVG